MVGSGDLKDKGSLVEEGVVCIKEWMRGQRISLKRGGRWEKGNILEGRGSREKARNTSGRDEEKAKREDKKHALRDGREEEVREYIVKKREGRGTG